MDSITNGTTDTTTAAYIPTPSSSSGSIMKFREDGLREPPLFTESPNMIIMIVGLSILIVPVVCFLVCICARTRLFETLRGLKFSSKSSCKDDDDISYCDGSNLPYSQFGSDDDHPKPKKPSSKDVRVLIQKDNFTTPGSPKITKDSKNNSKDENKVLVKPYAYNHTSSSGDEFNSSDADATFVVTSQGGERKSSLTTINLNS